MTGRKISASLSIMQAADRLALPRSEMVALVEGGTIASFFEGWNLRVSSADVEAYARRGENAAP